MSRPDRFIRASWNLVFGIWNLELRAWNLELQTHSRRMRYKPIIIILINLILIGIFICNHTLAQTPPVGYKFIKTNINRIENDSLYLKDFYQKLYRLKTTHQGVVQIVHIGDSHIQADGLSGIVRQNMQQYFGNAGRGLVFPYRVAKTNGPDGLKSSSNVEWVASRNVYIQDSIPIGICGITIQTQQPNASISETVRNTSTLDYAFNNVTLFYQQGDQFNYFEVFDSSGNANFSLKRACLPNIASYYSPIPVNSININAITTDSTVKKTARLYGLFLQNDSAGVVYNMVGINGAEYRHYLASTYFTEQLSFLEPDLIIISLGTNEAINARFNPDDFYYYIKQTIDAIQIKSPNAKFILTTPPDAYRWRRGKLYKVLNIPKATATMIRFCKENNIAYWDLNAVMGGLGSRIFWARAGLSSHDYIHFNAKGYQLQGKLLYDALIYNYEKYTR